MKEMNEKQLLKARSEFNQFKALGMDGMKSLKLVTPMDFFMTKKNSHFEELKCIGYNQKRSELTATVSIKRATGYAGDLCDRGSYEYVRFYLDYGSGWEDQGYVGFNVHDIPTEKDCDKKLEKPLDFVVRLTIKPKSKFCKHEVIPKVRAVLAWNSIPAPNDPNLTGPSSYTWGDVKDDVIQIQPKFFWPYFPINFTDVASLPKIDLNTLALNSIDPNEVVLPKQKIEFPDVVKLYKGKKVDSARLGLKLLAEANDSSDPIILENIKGLFKTSSLSFNDAFTKFKKLNCNTTYEQLHCVGLDYNRSALVGTFKVKKSVGYNGGLCSKGSKEFVSFWIQDGDSCKWEHAGTTSVDVHDINSIPANGISYSAVLPHNFWKYQKPCSKPVVLKVRAILSWNTPPVGMNCSGYGNVVETYIQLPARRRWNNGPQLDDINDVSVYNIDDATGLTLPNTKFGISQHKVVDGSAFGGEIVIRGVSNQNLGKKYKIRVFNHDTGAVDYLNNTFYVQNIYGVNVPISPIGDIYTYRSESINPDEILGRIPAGGDHKITISIEHLDGASMSQVIQLNNSPLELELDINDGGNCTHYLKGSTIDGIYTVSDNRLNYYNLQTNLVSGDGTFTTVESGSVNTSNNAFNIATNPSLNCGLIRLTANSKTVWNRRMKPGSRRDKTVCLK